MLPMPEITQSKDITGVVIVTPDVHGDNRGRFVETFRQEWLPDAAPSMVQGNRAD
jgi:dTDP-4-dehydrorhamnose 3,5-epimerase